LSAQKELEKLQAMRAELEAESRSLKEKQAALKNAVWSLEEEVANEALRKEKAAIEELRNRNKAAKNAIADLETKKKELESKLEQEPQKPEAPPAEKEPAQETPAQPKESQEASQSAETAPEETDEGGVTVTAIENEAIFENEAVSAAPKPEKKKHRFF